MTRISAAESKKIQGRRPAGEPKPAAKPKASGAAKTKGRTRHVRVEQPEFSIGFCIDLPCDPRPKERPRTVMDKTSMANAFQRANGNLAAFMSMVAKGVSRTYTPERTVDYEGIVALQARVAMRGRSAFEGPIEIVTNFTLFGREEEWPTSALDGDADNLAKAVWDAMKGIVFVDDRQVVGFSGRKVCGAKPKLEIEVRAARP